ncbi:MAG: type I glyceraldehyde-3-phosphate dehydrogenase [Dehalococcoidales bacterium]|nr:type I glyceraldehyde-3-phosphate dehydrogenase [Dehalococcoidales bacterium]
MKTRIGINGFGRIGRLTLRTILQRHKNDIEVMAVNDLTDARTNAHLFKWDSVYGPYNGEVVAKDKSIIVDGSEIQVLSERDPAAIPWKNYGVDIVIESTGVFTDADKARAHTKGGAKKVIISAPASNEDATIVLGVNEGTYDTKKHQVISNASCTTNGIAPPVKVLHQNFTVTKGLMTTIHSYTNDQVILDIVHKDIRRARAAALNMIPTTTGAAKLVGRLVEGLEGKIHGISIRVPTPSVSVIDFVCNTHQEVSVEQVNEAFRKAASGPMKGILEYCEEKLVSMDFKGNPHSSIIDAPSTMVMDKNMVKILAWYDNEWGYSCRLGDLVVFMANKGL